MSAISRREQVVLDLKVATHCRPLMRIYAPTTGEADKRHIELPSFDN